MAGKRKTFGPLLATALAGSLLILLGHGAWERWPDWRDWWALRKVVGDLRSNHPGVVKRAFAQLVAAGPTGFPWLEGAATDPDAAVRLGALRALGQVHPAPRRSVATFLVGLDDPDPAVRVAAAEALARIGPDRIIPPPRLVRLVEADPEPAVRLAAARALFMVDARAQINAGAAGSVHRALLTMLADPDPTHLPARYEIVEAIRRLDPDSRIDAAPAMTRALIPLVGSAERLSRRGAIEALERIGPPAREAIPALDRALRDDDPINRCLAGLALASIEGPDSGRARAVLRGLEDRAALPPKQRGQILGILTLDLTGGSELWQPIHLLRAVVAEYQRIEVQSGSK